MIKKFSFDSIIGIKSRKDFFQSKRLEYDDFIYETLNHNLDIRNATPYLFDLERNAFLYALNIDNNKAAKSPFHFQYLRNNVKEFGLIDFYKRYDYEYYNFNDPIFIFSSGRCGSTLLSKLISSFDILSISEPDFFNHLTLQYGNYRNESILLHTQKVMQIMTGDLLEPFDQKYAVLKLSSNANFFPQLILSVCRKKPRVIFMLRNFIDWVKSRKKAFNTDIQVDFQDYLRALESFKFIKNNCEYCLVTYEELVSKPDICIQKLSDFFMVKEFDQQQIDKIFREDSQENTNLSRKNLNEIAYQSHDDALLYKFWKENKPLSLLKELDLQDYF
jgi:hypothetical protein